MARPITDQSLNMGTRQSHSKCELLLTRTSENPFMRKVAVAVIKRYSVVGRNYFKGELLGQFQHYAQYCQCCTVCWHSVKAPLLMEKVEGSQANLYHFLTSWLALCVGKMNQILRCDWLPERARWRHLSHSGSRAVMYPLRHIINPLLTKLVRSRW